MFDYHLFHAVADGSGEDRKYINFKFAAHPKDDEQ